MGCVDENGRQACGKPDIETEGAQEPATRTMGSTHMRSMPLLSDGAAGRSLCGASP